jgi:hypothetical protein
MNGVGEQSAPFGSLRWVALVVGIACLGGATAALFQQPDLHEAYFRAYLFSWLFCLGLSLGSLMWVMMHHLMRANWSRAIQRLAEAASLNLGLVAVLFIPILFNLHYLYPWVWPQLLQNDTAMIHRQGYINPTGFVVRYMVYFAIWSALALLLASGSRSYDRNPNPAVARRMRALSAGGIPLIMVTMTLAGVDWLMSRDAQWYSSIFGFILTVGQAFSGLLLVILVLASLSKRSPLKEAATPQVCHDLGNLVLTLVILWSYLSFAQFLISWTGNVRQDIGWYYPRIHGMYGVIGCFLIFFHFFLPFFLLLMRQNKRKPQVLARIAALLLVFRLLGDYWLVVPTGFVLPGQKEILYTGLSWLNLALPPGLVGIWLAVFLWRLGRQTLLLATEIQDETLSVAKVNHGDASPQSA